MVNIYTEFSLETSNGLYIEGNMLIPYEDKKFFKPHTINIINGIFDTYHRNNNGEDSQKYRNYKEEIIRNCKSVGGMYETKKPFVYMEGKPQGLTGFASNMIGISTNREIGLKFANSKYKGLKMAKVLQNLKSYKGCLIANVVNINHLDDEVLNEFKILVNLVDANINTASSSEKESKNE